MRERRFGRRLVALFFFRTTVHVVSNNPHRCWQRRGADSQPRTLACPWVVSIVASVLGRLPLLLTSARKYRRGRPGVTCDDPGLAERASVAFLPAKEKMPSAFPAALTVCRFRFAVLVSLRIYPAYRVALSLALSRSVSCSAGQPQIATVGQGSRLQR